MIVASAILAQPFTWCYSALVAVVAYQLVTGRISTVGLLASQTNSAPDPERVVMLCLTTAGSFYYIGMTVGYGLPDSSITHLRLPDAPDWLVAGIGGGNLVYLTGKAMRSGFR